ncbi:hypothetical protein HOLleu_31325 [Holothuria leucospilota]|uniref:Uncharacterized protein n=1 Tax=Holothuria leucospilota TaxID=206669 RepID=A0A9Q1BHQ8_HOLLE|nr:hypothetical protein HOLleu_31325 [Holothuria leucospilota]
MVGNMQFLLINSRLQEILQNNLPFGRVQLIIVADLFQLKPVTVWIDGFFKS